jgi:hypothetical protein
MNQESVLLLVLSLFLLLLFLVAIAGDAVATAGPLLGTLPGTQAP